MNVVIILLFLILGVPGLWSFSPMAAIAYAAGLTYPLIRGMRCAQISLDDHGVEIRELLRTRSFRWNEILEVEVVSGSTTGLPWRVPGFYLRTGRLIRANEIRALGDETIVDRVVQNSRGHLL